MSSEVLAAEFAAAQALSELLDVLGFVRRDRYESLPPAAELVLRPAGTRRPWVAVLTREPLRLTDVQRNEVLA